MKREDELRANNWRNLAGMIETGEVESLESLKPIVSESVYAELVNYFANVHRTLDGDYEDENSSVDAPPVVPVGRKRSKLEPLPAYESACMVAMDLVQRLNELVQDMPLPDDASSINWGHVGDASHLCSLLGEAVSFLEGKSK